MIVNETALEVKNVVCCRLRTKGGWVPYGERVTWESGYIANAVFWCLDTADPVGPDDYFVHPHVCIAGRPCYRETSHGGQKSAE